MIEKRVREMIKDCLESNLKRAPVDDVQILIWLSNFERNDWEKALTVLSKIEYITEDEIFEGFKNGIDKILSETPKECNIIFQPSERIGETEGIGKSSTLITYHLKKVSDRHKNRRILSPNSDFLSKMVNEKEFDYNNNVLVIYDDFFGSGTQILEYYQKNISGKIQIEKFQSVYLLALYAMESSFSLIGKSAPELKIIAEKRKKAFAASGSVFGYRKKYLPLRKFCYKSAADKNLLTNQPLGYKNSQCLLVFPTGTPNNTLPIFWANKNGWYPLFPRFVRDKIKNAKAFRKDTVLLLKIAKDLGFREFITKRIIKEDYDLPLLSQDGLLLLCIIRAKRKTNSIPTICQRIGIKISTYEDILLDGQKRGLFDLNGNLTKLSVEQYENVLAAKSKYQDKNFWKNGFIDPNIYIFVPQMFQGLT